MQIDDRAFPLIVVHWQGAITDQQLVRFISQMTALADRAAAERMHYAVVSVGESLFSPAQRKRLSDWVESRSEEAARWDLGNFIVVASALARGVLTAVRWMTPKLKKVQTFATEEQALMAAREHLQTARLARSG